MSRTKAVQMQLSNRSATLRSRLQTHESKEHVRAEIHHTATLIDDYLRLTRDVPPRLAHRDGCDWPIREDHCFQRVVLDTICGGVWYAHLKRPAYKYLTRQQAKQAVDLSLAIADGRADLHELNRQSLVWRGKRTK